MRRFAALLSGLSGEAVFRQAVKDQPARVTGPAAAQTLRNL